MKSTKDDYIKRSAARHAVLHHTGDAARAAIDNIPPEDVVPVVRCGECNHRKRPSDYCEILCKAYMPDEFYCGCGKREEESNTRMKAKDIIKALEMCQGNRMGICSECPRYDSKIPAYECHYRLLNDAAGIIRLMEYMK